MACEEERTRLIGQIAILLRDVSVPEDARTAGLTLIAYLARRMPGEPVSKAGVEEMLRRCAERASHAASGGASEAGRKRTNGATATNGAAMNGAKAHDAGALGDAVTRPAPAPTPRSSGRRTR
jgi:hypothetical protein